MPQVFKIGSYWIYFWANEGKPSEPIHVHVAEGKPVENATKIWITESGKCLVANNNSKIPENHLRNIIRVINHLGTGAKWFASVSFLFFLV